jgi:hypothetical protein
MLSLWKKLFPSKKKRIWEGKYQVSTGRRSVNGYERKTFFLSQYVIKSLHILASGGQREVRKTRELALTETARNKE